MKNLPGLAAAALVSLVVILLWISSPDVSPLAALDSGTTTPTATPSLTPTSTASPTRTPQTSATATATASATPSPTASAAPLSSTTPTATPVAGPAPAAALPSSSATDGKFVGLSGDALQTLTLPAKIWVGVASNQATLTLDVFDGDLGGLWDNHDPLNSVQTQFLLYADPFKSGDPSDKTLIASATGETMADNDWTNLYNGPVHASARETWGTHNYLLVVKWSSSVGSAKEFNAFKVRGGAQVTLTPGQWAFVGAPINLDADPILGSPSNSYNGQWNWYLYTPPQSTSASFTECDADSRLHPSAPGDPPDDFFSDPRVRIAPDIMYTVYGPMNQLLINNLLPSGNLYCETKTVNVATGGLFRWSWSGVDAHNLIFIHSDYESNAAPETPVPIAPSPTPTNTPIPPTPTVPASATPTVSVTASPQPTYAPQPTADAGSAQPTETPSPTPTVAPTKTPPTPTETAVSIPVVYVDATPTPTPVIRQLPRTGEVSFDPLLPLASALFLVVAGLYLKHRLRQQGES